MLTKFTYKNHRGEIAERTVRQAILEHHSSPGHGYAPGWFITGLCLDKGERRSFALTNIIIPEGRVYRLKRAVK